MIKSGAIAMTDWVEANGASFRYDLRGEGADTLVLAHEMGGSIESWDDVVPALEKKFRVLRYDQRGFGLSEKTRDITADSMVADLLALLDALGLTAPCHLAGTAIGAALCIAFAARHPDRVKRMVVASPAPGGVEASARPLLEARMARVEREGMRAVVDASMDRIWPGALRGDGQRFARLRNRWMGIDPEGFVALNRALVTMDLAPELSKIACPTLVIGCTQDVIRPPAMSEQIANAIPGATYVQADSAHFMAIQAPERFVAHAVSFLTAG